MSTQGQVWRRALATLVVLPLTVVVSAVGSGAQADASGGDSSVTVEGTGEFAGLKVTVAQTVGLINQVVRVSWSGGAPTSPNAGSFDRNYLQIMQCWGDDPAGPTREQCQFGGLVGDSRGGAWVTSRQVSYGSQLSDPAETYTKDPNSNDQAYVPFESVGGKSVSGVLNEFYDAYSTNEIPFGRTRSDGTGEEFFEMQTAREAPGLGCGEALGSGSSLHGRSCWLVVVPRGAVEVDGSMRQASDAMLSSPLSATNWTHRLVVPLQFQPIGASCTVGSKERPTIGSELFAEALTRWQPVLCRDIGTVYGYSSVADAVARRNLVTADPGLSFISRPLDAGVLPAGTPVVYAPVSLSGLVVSYVIESQSSVKAPAVVREREGSRIAGLRLTPRLLAKLLTQSYRLGVNYSASQVENNPRDLTRDPDFLAVNPAFKALFFPGIADILVPLGVSDVAHTVWAYIASDADARAFLAGKPDPWGMKVNPFYKGMDTDRDDFPKSDPYCKTDFGDNRLPLCTLDAHPYSSDLHDAARAASRGETLARSVWDPTAVPPTYKKAPPQLSGTRAVLALTDSATAARYNLPTAALRNASGHFVEPTEPALLSAAAKAASGPGSAVKVARPALSTDDAYPMTTLTYAATVPSRLDAKARSDYAALLDYAAGAGQDPGLEVGQLPAGYAPLPAELRAQTAAVARLVLHPAPVIAPTPVASGPLPEPSAGSVGGGEATSAPTGSSPGTDGGAPPLGGGSSAPSSAPQITPRPTPAPRVVEPAASAATPLDAVGLVRFVLPAALVLGGLAAFTGPALLVPRRRGRR